VRVRGGVRDVFRYTLSYATVTATVPTSVCTRPAAAKKQVFDRLSMADGGRGWGLGKTCWSMHSKFGTLAR
jgi:hypothetical protein